MGAGSDLKDKIKRDTGITVYKITIERYFVCKNQLQYLEKPLKF